MSKQIVRTPQRILKVVKYLEGVISNDKAPERLRMQAAERLCELFLETERGKRERAISALRADARVEAARLIAEGKGTPEPDGQPTSQPDAIAPVQADSKVDVQAYLSQFVK